MSKKRPFSTLFVKADAQPFLLRPTEKTHESSEIGSRSHHVISSNNDLDWFKIGSSEVIYQSELVEDNLLKNVASETSPQ